MCSLDVQPLRLSFRITVLTLFVRTTYQPFQSNPHCLSGFHLFPFPLEPRFYPLHLRLWSTQVTSLSLLKASPPLGHYLHGGPLQKGSWFSYSPRVLTPGGRSSIATPTLLQKFALFGPPALSVSTTDAPLPLMHCRSQSLGHGLHQLWPHRPPGDLSHIRGLLTIPLPLLYVTTPVTPAVSPGPPTHLQPLLPHTTTPYAELAPTRTGLIFSFQTGQDG